MSGLDGYDSGPSTKWHIRRVGKYLSIASNNLLRRRKHHDESSLQEPEKSLYDKWRPTLSALVYNSPDYMDALAQMGPALQHHYASNRHHPEHYENGIDGMSLFDLLEMLIDWQAAIDRNGTGESVLGNFEATCERFSISPQLASILVNTAVEMGWGQGDDNE